MALEMMAGLDAVDHRLGSAVQLRIGIDTGPAVAGVIGVRRFIYDLWGDTVTLPAGWNRTAFLAASR